MAASPKRSRATQRGPRPQAPVDGAAGALVHCEALPWFPFLSDGVHVKLCRVNRSTGEIALLIRLDPGCGLGTHYYHGTLAAYTIAGTWRHRGADWVAEPGDVIVERAGSTHALETVGDRPVEAFIHLTGAIEFRDDGGGTLCIENAETLHGRYLAHCALHGICAVDVTQA